MLHFTFRVFLLLFPVFVWGQTSQNSPARPFTPKTNTVFYELGEDYIRVRILQYGDSKDLFFINLHDDEKTAVTGATKLLEKHGGTLVKIENDHNRNIRFKLDGRYYAFDPNRIFSRTGIIQTLNTFGPISKKAINELEKFAARILQLLPPPSTCVIALHNNYDGKFSVTSYMKGMERQKDAKTVRYKPSEDPDDLFLTTDTALFNRLSKEKFNIVLQDNPNAYKDGSLSVYCGEKNISYLNCETEHGHLKQYGEMITAAVRYLKTEPLLQTSRVAQAAHSAQADYPATVTYKYQLSSNAGPAGDYEIYFGEKKIGTIRTSINTPANTNRTGQMEIIKSFLLYDNMDFFFISGPVRKVELRVDPTRERKPVDPAKALILIKVN